MTADSSAVGVVLTTPEGTDTSVGRLVRSRPGAPVGFEYDEDYLSARGRPIDPELNLYPGVQYPSAGRMLFGALRDQAPDRWGRVLMDRRAALENQRAGRRLPPMTDYNYLLGVQDATRLGALRFVASDRGFLSSDLGAPPPVTSMAQLEASACDFENADSLHDLPRLDAALRLLVAPGSSLGGARPKACFIEADGSQWLAKFPARQDRYDVAAWEYLTHQLAQKAGLDVPEARLLRFSGGFHTFCVRRFDRTAKGRIHYASAMTLTRSADGEPEKSYLDIAAAVADWGRPQEVKAMLNQRFLG